MQSFLKITCTLVILVLASCEKDEEHQDAAAMDRVPPNSEKGTPPPQNPPPVPPATGSQGTVRTGTR